MEEDSKKRDLLPPQLLNLIPNEREWKGREAGGGARRSRSTSFGAEEDKKLELKLGLPGVLEEEIAAASRDKKMQQESSSVLSLGYFPKPSKFTTNTTTGAKRGFLDTVQAKSEGYDEREQQKQQGRAGYGKELSLGEEKIAAGERKKGCCPPPPSHASVQSSSRSPQGRAAAAPVVGWPPIRSFRRNLASSSSKQSPEPQNGEADAKAKLICKKRPLVKINMDGIPIGRKVDLAAYDSYEKLSSAVKELFRGFLEAQKDLCGAESGEQGAEEKIFSRLLDGTGEYTLVYEDNEGDRMLVGDVPWNVFVSTAKRLRVLRSSELSRGMIGAASRRVANC